MIKIMLVGCNGKMGQVITRLVSQTEDMQIVAGIDIKNEPSGSYPVFSEPAQSNVRPDVIIDFSNPQGLGKLLDYATTQKIPVVIATTGFSQGQVKQIKSASRMIPVFFTANMSLGVNLVAELVQKAAKVLEGNFDIEIIEKHHNQKIDAPSGTALLLADAINEVLEEKCEYVYDRHSRRKKRSKKEIGIHAIRGGTIVGEHTVIFAGNDEIIEIKHSALSKEIFAVGALRAARFVLNRENGLYDMKSLLNS